MTAFTFEDGGRTYTCRVEEPRATKAQRWWWFGVSGDGQRYAPFHAVKGDTQETVRTRILAYYEHLLARRAMPVVPRQHWAHRAKATPAAPPATT